MKRIIIFSLLLVISCKQKTKDSTKKDVELKTTALEKTSLNFDWLLGKWIRSNEAQGKETFENWDKVSNTEYKGIGFTLQKGDTIKQEKMTIININNNWKLLVKVPEEKEAIAFNISNLQQESFTFVNDTLDFPNTIQYRKKNDKIEALVSNDSLRIPFEFKRID